MTQTTWQASGATDASLQVPSDNAEASASEEKDQAKKSDIGDARHDDLRDEIRMLIALLSSNEFTSSEKTKALKGADYLRLLNELKIRGPESAGGWFSPKIGARRSRQSDYIDLDLSLQANEQDATEGGFGASGVKRVELRASEEFVELLDSLAQETKLSRAGVIRRSIALYARALLEKSRGNVIGIAALEDNQIKLKEIIQV